MITAALDRELAAVVSMLVTRGDLPAEARRLNLAGTWRRAADGRPAAFATALPFGLADLAGGTPGSRAAALAAGLTADWVSAADPAGGYLTLTVTDRALAQSAAQMAAAGRDCARSTILAGTSAPAAEAPWPDLAAAPGFEHAWLAQAAAMTQRLEQTAGGPATPVHSRERADPPPPLPSPPGGPLAAIVAYRGADMVRYRLARTPPGAVGRTAAQLQALLPAAGQPPPALPGWPGPSVPDPLTALRAEHAAAASALRRATVSGGSGPAATSPGELPASVADRELLTQLALLPVRVAAAARRRRPDELPRYLESVGAAWRDCRAAGLTSALTAARLVLAEAVVAVLASGLELTGIPVG